MSVPQYLQGHTPHDRLSYLVTCLCTKLNAGKASADVLALAEQAKAVIDGYDAYLAQMSSPAPAVLDTIIAEGNRKDWEAIHREGKTQFRLIPEMTAGGYEAVVLQQLAKLAKVCLLLCCCNRVMSCISVTTWLKRSGRSLR
jgi:caffeoyl-CoA O-methyltransferase